MSEPAPLVDVLLRQSQAWQRGQRIDIEELLLRHPHLASDPNAVLDLIYNEVVLREQAGEVPALDDYLPRFPHLETDLRVQFEVDQALTMEEVAGAESPLSTVPHAAAPSSHASADWLHGVELIEEVGRGAMGTVWRAWQPSAHRVVAVKLLALDVPPGRIRTEIEAAARLSHPNILPVFEVREDGGRTALILEYADGGNLAKKLAGKPQSPRDSARLLETLAWGMAHAHDRGVVHRDLKPSNVLLVGDEEAHLSQCVPRIGDFGLAKLLESDQQLTRTNDILGTPSYMAPEQTGGKGEVGPAADIYALGAILYECLTGRPPFLGESVLDTLAQLRHQEPVPPSRLQPRTPRDLEVICLKCLHKVPARRYASARELAEDLRHFQAGEPIRGRAVGLPERVWKWAKRRPTAAALSVVTLVTALVLVGSAVAVNQMLRRQRDLARRQAGELDAQLKQTRQLLYTTQLLRVGAIWPTDPQQALLMLEDEVACPLDLRCFTWGVLHGQCKRHRLAWPAHPGGLTALALSPDGKTLATGGQDGQVKLWNAETRQPLATLTEHTDAVAALAFAPDGKSILSGGHDGLIKMWDITDRKSRGTIRLTGGRVSGLAFHSSGKMIASTSAHSGAGFVQLWDARTLVSRRVLARDAHPLTGVALSPDGNTLAASDLDHAVRLYDTRTGRLLSRLRGHTAPVTALAFGPNGKPLVTGALDGNVRLWDVESDSEIDSFDSAVGAVATVAVHPGGQSVAIAGRRGTDPTSEVGPDLQTWDRLARRGEEPARSHGGLGGLAFRPDGKALFSGGLDGTLKLWDQPGRRERALLRDPVAQPGTIALSRDGRMLAWVRRQPPGGPGRLIDVYDLQRGTIDSTLRGHGRDIRGITVLGDGRFLASTSGGDDEPAELLVWEARTGRLSQALSGHATAVTALASSGDGSELLAVDRGGVVKVWDVAAGKARLTLTERGITWRAAVYGDQHFAAAGRDANQAGVIVAWNADGSEARRLHLPEAPMALALAPDGSRLAWAGAGGLVRLVGEDEVILNTAMKEIANIAFSPDGSTLAAAGSGSAVKLYDVPSAQERAALPAHRGGACFAGFAGDGRLLVTAGVTGQARLWHRGE